MKTTLNSIFFLAGYCLATASPGNAQNSASPSAMDQQAQETTLDTMLVLPADSILPTSRPVNSVYGVDRSVLETPRSVGMITKEQMESYDALAINVVNQYSSGITGNAGYGVQGLPIIRADLGDAYQNGIRIASNRVAFPVNLNSVESIDIVKGPAGAVYGPGNYMGGYINFTTKLPYFDKFHGELSTSLGSYVPGGQSFKDISYTLDLSGPIIKNELAYRLSFNQKNADSYYQYAKDEEIDIFVALTYIPNDQWEFNLNADFYTASYTEIDGTNRVTQDLIDNQTYTTGPAVPGPFGDAFGYTVPSATAGKRKIYGYQTVVTDGAGAQAKAFNAQLSTTYHATDNFQIVNRTFFQNIERQDQENLYYAEVVPYYRVFENRTEFQGLFDLNLLGLPTKNQTNSGFSFRSESMKAYNSYSEEPLSAYDLTQPLETRTIQSFLGYNPFPNTAYAPIILQVPGENLYAEPSTTDPAIGNTPNPNTKVSNVYTVGLFHQHNLKLGEQWSLDFGGRGNLLFADAHDPLPPPGVKAASDSTTQFQYSVNGSLGYKPTTWANTYFTYNRTSYTNTSSLGGLLFPGELRTADFHGVSDLFELGAKFQIIPDKLISSAAVFYQKRSTGSLVGQTNEIETNGIELDTVYEPDRHFNFFANFTWMEANYIDLYPAVSATPGGFGTDRPLNDFNFYATLPTANYRVLGVPRITANAYATYKFENGFGVRIGGHIESSQPLDFSNTAVIPTQYYLNASVFYTQPTWECGIDIQNFTDQRVYMPVDTEYTAGDLVLQSLPLNISAHIKIRF